MKITLHPDIKITEAQHMAKMHGLQIVPDQRHPGEYIMRPRIVRHDHHNNVTNIRRQPVPPVDYPTEKA